ncbi:MAG TPA: hypothetical protein PKM48_10645, partial [Parvularculaceae bacterium]|nr:hypothetical protein [Parvularculaceae bacterium]
MYENGSGPARGNFEAQLDASIKAAADWLKANQKPEGYWVGRLESNACMEAQWILCLWFMGLEDHHLRPRLAESLKKTQRADGSWEIY